MKSFKAGKWKDWIFNLKRITLVAVWRMNGQPSRASVKGQMRIRRLLQKPKKEMIVAWFRVAEEMKVRRQILKDKINNTWGMIRYGGKEGRCK